jgi:hypothetical protein
VKKDLADERGFICTLEGDLELQLVAFKETLSETVRIGHREPVFVGEKLPTELRFLYLLKSGKTVALQPHQAKMLRRVKIHMGGNSGPTAFIAIRASIENLASLLMGSSAVDVNFVGTGDGEIIGRGVLTVTQFSFKLDYTL